MIGNGGGGDRGLFGWFVSSAFGLAALQYGAIAVAIFLFLLWLRLAGERAGRLAETSRSHGESQ